MLPVVRDCEVRSRKRGEDENVRLRFSISCVHFFGAQYVRSIESINQIFLFLSLSTVVQFSVRSVGEMDVADKVVLLPLQFHHFFVFTHIDHLCMMKSLGKPSTPRSAPMSVVFYVFIFASVFLTFQGARIACKENPLTEFLNSAGVLPDIHFSTTGSSLSSVSTSLAYNQSFGFFDDIRDDDWKIAQRIHAKTFPNTFRGKPEKYSNGINDRGKIEKLRWSAHWYAENFQEEFHCELKEG